MKTIKTFLLFALIALLVLCCSCKSKEVKMKLKITPPDKNICEIIKEPKSDEELRNILDFNGTLEELNKKHPIHCIRENDAYFRLSYRGKNKIAILLFDKNGEKIYSNIYNATLLKDDFKTLKKGSTLDAVQDIDPKGAYTFLYTGRNDIPRESYHYTKDGFVLIVEYNASNIITKLHEELI